MKRHILASWFLFAASFATTVDVAATPATVCLDLCQAEFRECLSHGPAWKPYCIAELSTCRSGC